MDGSGLGRLAIEAQTSFPALLLWLQAERPYEREEDLGIDRRPLEGTGTVPHLFAREAFEPKAHKPPHPEYIEGETILGKTRYGIPVTPSKFENNSFLHNGLDKEDLYGDQWWVAERTARLRSLERLNSRVEAGSIVSLTPSDRFDLDAWRRERKALGFRSTRKPKRTASSSSLSDYRRWLEANEAAHECFSNIPGHGRSSIASASSLFEYRRWLEENKAAHGNDVTDVENTGRKSIASASSAPKYGKRLEANAAAYENNATVVEDAGRNSVASTSSRPEYRQWIAATAEEEFEDALERQPYATSQSSAASSHTTSALPYQRVNIRMIDLAPTQRSIIQPRKPKPTSKLMSKCPKRKLSTVTKSKYSQYTKNDLLSLKEYLEIQEKKLEPPPTKRPESMTIKEYVEYQAKKEDLKLGFFFSIKRTITSIPLIFKGFLQTKLKVRKFKRQSKQLQQKSTGKNKMIKATSMESMHPKKKRILYPIRRTRAKYVIKTKKGISLEPYVPICKDDGIALPEITVDRHLWIDSGFDTSAVSDRLPKGWGIDWFKEAASEYKKDFP